MTIINEISLYLATAFSQINMFGLVFAMFIVILGGAAMCFQGVNLSSNAFNSKGTQLAGDFLSLTGLCVLGGAMVLTMALDTALNKGMIALV